jgi:hypothetical protein
LPVISRPEALEKRPPFGMAASPDDGMAPYTQFDQEPTGLMLLERITIR